MIVYIADQNFNIEFVVDFYKSVIWKEEFVGSGEFEIYIPIDLSSSHQLEYIAFEQYIGMIVYLSVDSFNAGIIRKFEANYDSENGATLVLYGEMLIGLLSQRIVSTQTNLNTNAVNAIKTLINNNTSGYDRSFNFPINFHDSYDVPSISIKKQVTYTNLFETIKEILDYSSYGMKITRVISNVQNISILFYDIYIGTNRQNNIELNPDGNQVKFSFEYGNLISYKQISDISEYCNSITVAGEGQGTSRKVQTWSRSNAVKNKRFEKFEDARNISSNDGQITNEEYYDMLFQQCTEYTTEHQNTKKIEISVIDNKYKYGEDYSLGDIVDVVDMCGLEQGAKVTSVTRVWDDNGYKCEPTLQL